MEDIYIKEIIINKVRHLSDISIKIDDNERKHLIITGKNGSGKTSLLMAMRDVLKEYSNRYNALERSKNNIQSFRHQISGLENQLKNSTDEQQRASFRGSILTYQNAITQEEAQFANISNLDLIINNLEYIQEEFTKGNYIVASFNARRTTEMAKPNGIHKVQLSNNYQAFETANKIFIQYLVNLKAQRSFAKDDNKNEEAEEIDNWFSTFEGLLREIFDDQSLKLEFDRDNYNFNIVLEGKEKFDFNSLSDGYSAILNIITELILRMENKSSKTFNMQGIVLIDEVETHLHIELQKLILPFLTKVFPKIQFIVTTHSPFVLNSISNAVIYDLEKKIQVSDLSGYSIDGIVEGYFDSDKYSIELKKLVEEYEILSTMSILEGEKENRYRYLKEYFKNVPKFLAPELELKIQQVELAKIGGK